MVSAHAGNSGPPEGTLLVTAVIDSFLHSGYGRVHHLCVLVEREASVLIDAVSSFYLKQLARKFTLDLSDITTVRNELLVTTGKG